MQRDTLNHPITLIKSSIRRGLRANTPARWLVQIKGARLLCKKSTTTERTKQAWPTTKISLKTAFKKSMSRAVAHDLATATQLEPRLRSLLSHSISPFSEMYTTHTTQSGSMSWSCLFMATIWSRGMNSSAFFNLATWCKTATFSATFSSFLAQASLNLKMAAREMQQGQPCFS